MRPIVFFSFPAHGHINPTLPVVRELVRRGEQVIYYATEPFSPAIRDTGAMFRPYAPKFRMPEGGPGPFAQLSTTLDSLLDLTLAVLEGNLREVRMLRPTHILFDSFAPWGSLVAQLLGLPTIASIPSIAIDGDIDSRYRPAAGAHPADPHLTARWNNEFRARCHAGLRRYDLREPPSPQQLLQSYGDGNLVYTSRLFQPLAEHFDAHRFEFVGPCFDGRLPAPPFPFERCAGRPLVLVSLGTVYGNNPQFFRACLEELADTPWQIVLSTGADLPLESLGPIPEDFIVRTFVPQIEILRRCRAFVTHGGMNGVQEALYFGVPLVIAPQAADQFWISARADELGAAVVLDARRMKAGAIRGSVAQVLSNPPYATAAARIGASLRAAGGSTKAADAIHRFMRCNAGAAASQLAAILLP
jgi:MGT family glycosyltransferase